MDYIQLPPRESDQRVFVADISKAKLMIDWSPRMSKSEGIKSMINWVSREDL